MVQASVPLHVLSRDGGGVTALSHKSLDKDLSLSVCASVIAPLA
jgi:hypothetical protein